MLFLDGVYLTRCAWRTASASCSPRLPRKRCSRQVKPEHTPVVANHLSLRRSQLRSFEFPIRWSYTGGQSHMPEEARGRTGIYLLRIALAGGLFNIGLFLVSMSPRPGADRSVHRDAPRALRGFVGGRPRGAHPRDHGRNHPPRQKASVRSRRLVFVRDRRRCAAAAGDVRPRLLELSEPNLLKTRSTCNARRKSRKRAPGAHCMPGMSPSAQSGKLGTAFQALLG